MRLRKRNVAEIAAEPAPVRWVDRWPAVVILAGVGVTLLWIVLVFWFAEAAVEWLIG